MFTWTHLQAILKIRMSKKRNLKENLEFLSQVFKFVFMNPSPTLWTHAHHLFGQSNMPGGLTPLKL